MTGKCRCCPPTQSLPIAVLYPGSKQQQQMTSSQRESELAAENVRLKRQRAERDEEPVIPPKGRDIVRESPEMKVIFIEKYQAEFSIRIMCRVPGVTRSGGMPGSNAVTRSACISSSVLTVIMRFAGYSVRQNNGMVCCVLQPNCRNTT